MTGFEKVTCAELRPGHVVRFSETMCALEEERVGTFEVVRIWRWDTTSYQVRLREIHSGRALADAIGSHVVFWRLVPKL